MNIPILQEIWAQSEGNNIFLPRMIAGGVWSEGPAFDPRQVSNEHIMDEHDQYFSVLPFNGPQRRREYVGRPGVIFADLDASLSKPWPNRMMPSVLIKSSPSHHHAYWFLTKPADPDEWEPRAKGMTQLLGADPGGWDLTQVLRVPGTFNYKYNPPESVKVLYTTGYKYTLEQFPYAEVIRGKDTDCPTPDYDAAVSYLARAFAIGSMPLSARYWLTVSKEDLLALGKISRSHIMWGLERSLLEHGFTPDEVFQLLWHAPINKWGQPSELWREVQKAAAY